MRNRAGAGLIEPAIALLVLATATVPLVAGLGTAGTLTRHGRSVTRAGGLAEAALERATAARYDDVKKDKDTVEVEPGLAAVRVRVAFERPAGRGEATVELARLVGDPTVALRGPVAIP